MPIKKIALENFTVFDKLDLEFGEGINVFIGENGTGKTHLLKLIYAFCETEAEKHEFSQEFAKVVDYVFNNANDYVRLPELANDYEKGFMKIGIQDNSDYFGIDITKFDDNGYNFKRVDFGEKKKTNSVCIPVIEMLSHSKEFLSFFNKYKLPFDGVAADIIINSQLPEIREITENEISIISKLNDIIGGKVIYENDSFFVLKSSGKKVRFSIEAEGFRKIALICKLIQSGLLSKGSVLLWDEPEANINPVHIPYIVEMLLELQRSGVQIFVSTHDYIFAKYFEVRRKAEDKVVYHSLFRKNEIIESESNINFRDLENNSIISAFDMLLDEVYNKNIGD